MLYICMLHKGTSRYIIFIIHTHTHTRIYIYIYIYIANETRPRRWAEQVKKEIGGVW